MGIWRLPCRYVGLACLALLSSALPVCANPGDYISINASGLMSSGLQIRIDLETGHATKSTTPHGYISRGEQLKWDKSERQLSPDELSTLKATIDRNLTEGFESQACKDEEQRAAALHVLRIPRLPPADAMAFLAVRLNGKSGNTPDPGCSTPAYTAVWQATYQAASGPPEDRKP
jgi:hypothetical protein